MKFSYNPEWFADDDEVGEELDLQSYRQRYREEMEPEDELMNGADEAIDELESDEDGEGEDQDEGPSQEAGTSSVLRDPAD